MTRTYTFTHTQKIMLEWWRYASSQKKLRLGLSGSGPQVGSWKALCQAALHSFRSAFFVLMLRAWSTRLSRNYSESRKRGMHGFGFRGLDVLTTHRQDPDLW